MSFTDGRIALVLALLCTTLITTHGQNDDCKRVKLSKDAIEYPKTNANYRNNLNCTWTLPVESTSQRISLQFTTFHLEEENEDGCPDYVEIWDGEIGSGRNLSGQLCGELEDLQANGDDVHISTGNRILIRMITNKNQRREGFVASYTEFEATTTDRQTTESTSGATSTQPSTLATSERSSPNAGISEPSTNISTVSPNPQRTTYHVLDPSEPTPKATDGLDEPESQNKCPRLAVTVVVGIVAVIVIILVIIVGVCLRRSRRKAVSQSVQPLRDDSLYQSPVSDTAEHRDTHPPQFDNMSYLPVGIGASADHPFSDPADPPPPYESCLPADAVYDDDTGNNTTPEGTTAPDTGFERNVAYESYGKGDTGETRVETTPDSDKRGGKDLIGSPGESATALPDDPDYYYVSETSDKEGGFATNDAYESYEDARGDHDGTLSPDVALEDNIAYRGYEEQGADDLPDVDRTSPGDTDYLPEEDQGHGYSSVGDGDERIEENVAYESYDNAARTDDSDADGDYGHDYAKVGNGTDEEGFTTNVAYVGYGDSS